MEFEKGEFIWGLDDRRRSGSAGASFNMVAGRTVLLIGGEYSPRAGAAIPSPRLRARERGA
jgi:hypothetical protein